jgi:hypothetical protein
MGLSRIEWVLAAAGLLVSACSGSDLVNGLGTSNPAGDTTDATIDSPAPPDDRGPAPREAGLAPGPRDGGAAEDGGGVPADATSSAADATSGYADATLDAGTDASPTDSAATDGASDAETVGGGTFACGPTKRCLEATEYCRIAGLLAAGNIVVPLDGGKLTPTYSCLALPPCDAADECTCLPGSGILLAQSMIVVGSSCSCSDQDGGITQTCTSGGPLP